MYLKKLTRQQQRGVMYMLIAVGLFLVFWKIADSVVWDKHLDAVDAAIAAAVYTIRTPFLNQVMQAATELASVPVVVVVSAAVLVFLYLHRRKYILPLVLSLAGAGGFTYIFKLIFARPRPDPVSALVPETGFSFPSGHALIAICLYGVLAYFLMRVTRSWPRKTVIVIVAAFLILLVGFSRVYLGVHWPTDVLGSYILGGSWLYLLAGILEIATK